MQMRPFLIALLLITLITIPFEIQSTAAQSDAPFFIATCQDGRQVIGHRLILENLPVNRSIRFTAIGEGDFDPTIAILSDAETADCATNTPEVAGSTVALPSVGRIEANNFSAQLSIPAGQDGRIDIIVGGFAGQSGQYALVIENMGIFNPGEVDTVRVQIPPSTYQEWVGMFMIGEEDTIDPLIQVYAGEVGTPIIAQCDNAGTQSCPTSSTLIDRGAILGQRTYSGDDFDAGVMSTYDQNELTFAFRDVGGTGSGEYAIIMTGIAPGAVANRTFICDTVDIELREASPAYNPAYQLANILDGNPDTFWVTGAPPLNAEGVRDQNAFVVIGVLEDRPINRIRINGYAQALDGIEQNSLKRFALRFPDASEAELVTALDAELALQAGYQSFSFLPTQIDEFGLILLDNYGGTLFVLVDLEICGQP